MGIFQESQGIKAVDYPELVHYAKAIHRSFWHDEHFTYDKDVKDYKVALTNIEREAVKRSMLAIGVVENKVKTFWARIDQRMPKPEIADVGHTFAGNEVIHKMTYTKLLELLGLDTEFENILNVPCMQGRANYLVKYLDGVTSRNNKEFTKSLILFTLLVENAALFSQFLIVSSFAKYKNVLKNFSTVITATSKEENIHGKFGSALINIIRNENPEWFDQEMMQKIYRSVHKAFKAECEVLDWIFEHGELDFISKEEIKEYLKSRFNTSLQQINYPLLFNVDAKLLEKSNYMEVAMLSTKDFDFFAGKSTDYNESNSYSEDNLWN